MAVPTLNDAVYITTNKACLGTASRRLTGVRGRWTTLGHQVKKILLLLLLLLLLLDCRVAAQRAKSGSQGPSMPQQVGGDLLQMSKNPVHICALPLGGVYGASCVLPL